MKNKIKILFFDGCAETRDLAQMTLSQRFSCSVICAGTLKDAEVVADKNSDADFIFLPGRFGARHHLETTDFARRLRAHLCPNAHIFAVSVRSDWTDILLKAGCHDSVTKNDLFDGKHFHLIEDKMKKKLPVRA